MVYGSGVDSEDELGVDSEDGDGGVVTVDYPGGVVMVSEAEAAPKRSLSRDRNP